MAKSARATLAAARKHALSLPETTEAPHHDYGSFRVRGKIFATIPPDGEHLHIFVDDELRERMVTLHPEAFEKLWWGKKVVGLRVMLAHASAGQVSELLTTAWYLKAPKTLVAAFESQRG
ncbi:MAG: MmcQ/YjbR family DNA-binding protein [Betaproteobacteria bacterium]|nr:MmcQ/YjbR family DNA-binding protein [Betaproteobacteria bacterium]